MRCERVNFYFNFVFKSALFFCLRLCFWWALEQGRWHHYGGTIRQSTRIQVYCAMFTALGAKAKTALADGVIAAKEGASEVASFATGKSAQVTLRLVSIHASAVTRQVTTVVTDRRGELPQAAARTGGLPVGQHRDYVRRHDSGSLCGN
jgi:hypothetical protein